MIVIKIRTLFSITVKNSWTIPWRLMHKRTMGFPASAWLIFPVAGDRFSVFLQFHVPQVALLVRAFSLLPKLADSLTTQSRWLMAKATVLPLSNINNTLHLLLLLKPSFKFYEITEYYLFETFCLLLSNDTY